MIFKELYIFFLRNYYFKVVKILIDYGASLNVQDKRGRTPAHAGAAKGRTLTTLGF